MLAALFHLLALLRASLSAYQTPSALPCLPESSSHSRAWVFAPSCRLCQRWSVQLRSPRMPQSRRHIAAWSVKRPPLAKAGAMALQKFCVVGTHCVLEQDGGVLLVVQ